MENLSEVLTMFLSVANLLALGAGVLIGIVIGAIPGLSTTMAVALALPFTFTMPPITAILLLTGIYKGGLYGGSITAILIRTPGTPASACTVLDGYPLARKGKARKALEMALYSSFVADVVSNICLILFAGFLAQIALKFGPPEFFWLICFALTVIISVSDTSLTKGLFAAALGLLLALVGIDRVYGTERLTFGTLELYDGLSIVPVLIGLFALPEIFNYYMFQTKLGQDQQSIGTALTWNEFRASLRSILKGSLIGVIIGAIPGTGATAASFISYSEARRTSKNPENFGKGELEGVAAAEAGNNAVAGATMIPLIALGIPGDVVTAVILGAFLIQGLTPGPLMFQENITLMYALFTGIMVGSLFLLIVGKFALRYCAQITRVPSGILFPSILLLCVFGTFAVQNSIFDIWVLIAFGVLGFIMSRLHIPTAPLLIGFVLGSLLEDNLRNTLLISAGDHWIFLRRPIDWVFILLTVLSLAYSFWSWRKRVRAAAAVAA